MLKVVLKQDVEHLGPSGTIHTVKDGFARNYLIPKGLAVLATPGELKQAEERLAAQQRRIAKQEAELQGLAQRIEGQVLVFEARVGPEGRLFGSITAGDIASKLSQQVGEEIDRRRVALDEPIRHAGEHTIHVHLVGRLNPSVTVRVEGISDTEESEAGEA